MADQTPDAMMTVGVEVSPAELDRAVRQIVSLGQKVKPVSIPVSLIGGDGGSLQMAMQQLYRQLEKAAKNAGNLHIDLGGMASDAKSEMSMVAKHMVDGLAKDPAWAGLEAQMTAIAASAVDHAFAAAEKRIASRTTQLGRSASQYGAMQNKANRDWERQAKKLEADNKRNQLGPAAPTAAQLASGMKTVASEQAKANKWVIPGEPAEMRQLRKAMESQFRLLKSQGMSVSDAASQTMRFGESRAEGRVGVAGARGMAEQAGAKILFEKQKAEKKELDKAASLAAENLARTESLQNKDDRQFSPSGINKVKKKFEHLYGNALFEASDKAIDDFLEKAETRFGKGTAGYNEAVGRMQEKFGPIVESRRQIGEATTDRIAQSTLESLGGAAGTTVSSADIKTGLEKALADQVRTRDLMEGKIKNGDTSASTKSQAYQARQFVFDIESRLERLKKLDREEEVLFRKMEARGSKKSGGQFGTIEAREMEKIRAAKLELYGGGGVRGKTSAHGAQFAAMNAAYGFQDFFQVLAQPGMGPGRAFLAAANNIGPALGMIPGVGLKATLAVGGLMAGMSALNMVMDKGDRKSQDLARSLRLLAQSYTDTENARRGVRIGTMPVGSDMGGSGYEESFKNMGFGASGRSSHREISKFFADTELERTRKLTHSDESKGFVGKTWDNLFRPSGEGMAAGFYKTLSESLHNLTNTKGYAPDSSLEGGVFSKPLSRNEIRQKYGLSGGVVGATKERFAYDVGSTANEEYEKFWGEGGPGKSMLERKAKAKASLDASSAFSSENEDPVSKLIGGIKNAMSDEANLGISFRGHGRSAIEKAMKELPGDLRLAKSHLDRAKVPLGDFEDNDLRSLESARKQSKAISSQIAEIKALNTADADIAIMELERRKKQHDAIISVMGDEHEALKKNVQVIEEFINKIGEVPKEIAKIPGAGRLLRQVQFPDAMAAAEGNVGGYLEKGRYGTNSGAYLNFQEKIMQMQRDLAGKLRGGVDDKAKSDLRAAHEKAVAREIESFAGGSGTGKASLMDSGSLWSRIQESLTSDPLVDLNRKQLDELRSINAALHQGKNPASPMYQGMLQPIEGNDAGGYAGSGKKPSARDTILAKLREGEVVLTPEHQARLAQRLKMSPADLFGGMGMTHKGSSLSAWANVGGFDGGGMVGGGFLEGFQNRRMTADNYRKWLNGEGGPHEFTRGDKKYDEPGNTSFPDFDLPEVKPGFSSSPQRRSFRNLQKPRGEWRDGRYQIAPTKRDYPQHPRSGLLGAYGYVSGVEGQSENQGKDTWKGYDSLHKKMTRFNRDSRRWDEEEPFRERYAEYGRQSARFGMSGFYRNQGVPLYGRGAGGQGGRTLSGPRVPTNAEAWPGGMPFISAPGTALNLPRSGKSYDSFEEAMKQRTYRETMHQIRGVGATGHESSVSTANAMQLAEMKRRGMSQHSVDAMGRTHEGSAERAAEARRQQAVGSQRKVETEARKSVFQEERKKADADREAAKRKAREESEAKAKSAKEAYKAAQDEAKKKVKNGEGFAKDESTETDERRKASSNRMADALAAKRLGMTKDQYSEYQNRVGQGFSEEDAKSYATGSGPSYGKEKPKGETPDRKQTLGERLLEEQDKRLRDQGLGSYSMGPSESIGEKMLREQKERLNKSKAGLGDRMEEVFPGDKSDPQKRSPYESWKKGQKDDADLRKKGNELEFKSLLERVDAIPQNVSGRDQAASGVGFSGNDRNTAVLERIATILEGTDRNSTKHSEKVLDAIQSSGISIQ